MADLLSSKVVAIYERHPHHILPYIGDAFVNPKEDELRMLAVGINSYASKKDWPPEPEWHRSWVADRSHRYYKGAASEADVIARAVEGTPLFGDRVYTPKRCLYATNAIKVYMHEERGKRASDLRKADFDAHADQWRDELSALAEAGVMPHVVVIFSKVYWPYAWKVFHPSHGGPNLGVTGFEAVWGDAPHRINRITLRKGEKDHELLLIRLRHPAGRGEVGTAGWLCEREGFRTALQPTREEEQANGAIL